MKSSVVSSLLCLALSWTTSAHMEMSNPLPIRSSFDMSIPEPTRDYNLKSPLTANGSNYPCHGYHNERPILSKATYVAGSQYSMSIAGAASHGGGSCQLSLSYDNGGTWKVIKSIIGGCPLTTTYQFTVPAFAPSGSALFAWTWFNEIGNREMYMNCAWVTIQGSSSARRKARLAKRQGAFTSMASLPTIWRANIAGLGTCGTVEGTDPVFANPGPDVVYGGRMSASSPVTNPGQNCDNPEPRGQAYQAATDTSPLGQFPGGAGAVPAPVPAASSARAAASAAQSSAAPAPAASSVINAAPSAAPAASSAPTPPAPSSVAPPPAQASVAAPVPSSARVPPAASSVVVPGNPRPSMSSHAKDCSDAQHASPTGSPSSHGSSRVSYSTTSINSSRRILIPVSRTTMTTATTTRTTATTMTMSSTVAAASAAASAARSLIGATFAREGDLASYLPCVPGAILCLSPTRFVICGPTVGGIPWAPMWAYVGAQPVAAGMACQPYLARIPDSDAAARMGSQPLKVPPGYFRSDRYVSGSLVTT